MFRLSCAFALIPLLIAGCGNDDRPAAATDAGVDSVADTSTTPDAPADSTPDAAADTAPQPPVEECIPYDDQCSDGEYCQYFEEGDPLRCIPDGDVVADPGGSNPECPTGVCSRGGICMPMRNPFGNGSRFICYQPCEVGEDWEDRDCFNGRHTCWPALGADGEELSFGICDY